VPLYSAVCIKLHTQPPCYNYRIGSAFLWVPSREPSRLSPLRAARSMQILPPPPEWASLFVHYTLDRPRKLQLNNKSCRWRCLLVVGQLTRVMDGERGHTVRAGHKPARLDKTRRVSQAMVCRLFLCQRPGPSNICSRLLAGSMAELAWRGALGRIGTWSANRNQAGEQSGRADQTVLVPAAMTTTT